MRKKKYIDVQYDKIRVNLLGGYIYFKDLHK